MFIQTMTIESSKHLTKRFNVLSLVSAVVYRVCGVFMLNLAIFQSVLNCGVLQILKQKPCQLQYRYPDLLPTLHFSTSGGQQLNIQNHLFNSFLINSSKLQPLKDKSSRIQVIVLIVANIYITILCSQQNKKDFVKIVYKKRMIYKT